MHDKLTAALAAARVGARVEIKDSHRYAGRGWMRAVKVEGKVIGTFTRRGCKEFEAKLERIVRRPSHSKFTSLLDDYHDDHVQYGTIGSNVIMRQSDT